MGNYFFRYSMYSVIFQNTVISFKYMLWFGMHHILNGKQITQIYRIYLALAFVASMRSWSGMVKIFSIKTYIFIIYSINYLYLRNNKNGFNCTCNICGFPTHLQHIRYLFLKRFHQERSRAIEVLRKTLIYRGQKWETTR